MLLDQIHDNLDWMIMNAGLLLWGFHVHLHVIHALDTKHKDIHSRCIGQSGCFIPLMTEVYFCQPNQNTKILVILRFYWNPTTLVLIWKVLRQAFRWYHYFGNPSTFGRVRSLFEIFSKYVQSLKGHSVVNANPLPWCTSSSKCSSFYHIRTSIAEEKSRAGSHNSPGNQQ
jgi:hypothetical protein